jgi:hypothetical protein
MELVNHLIARARLSVSDWSGNIFKTLFEKVINEMLGRQVVTGHFPLLVQGLKNSVSKEHVED